MTDVVRPPDLKPRRGLFLAAIGVFAMWLGLLAWLYVSQVVMKRA